jgi:hypothetical protein
MKAVTKRETCSMHGGEILCMHNALEELKGTDQRTRRSLDDNIKMDLQ